jgi:triacylglycerol lipase
MKKFVLVIVLLAGAFALYVALSPPGRNKVVDQDDRDGPSPPPVTTLIGKLRADWDSEGFADWPVAEVMAEASQISYLPPVEAKERFREAGFDSVEAFVDGSMIGYVVSVEDACVIAFRGTDDVGDWIANLDRRAVRTPHGEVHRGFHDSYQRLKSQITSIIESEQPEQLWITGHSLGGALAVVCAYDLAANEDKEINGLVTFGQPMVVRSEMADHLDDVLLGKFAHYVHAMDLVPRIPPSFQHCGSMVWFTGNGVKRSEPKRPMFGAPAGSEATDVSELPLLSDEEFEQLQADINQGNMPETLPDGTPLLQGNSPFIRDHGMEFYIEKVKATLTGN